MMFSMIFLYSLSLIVINLVPASASHGRARNSSFCHAGSFYCGWQLDSLGYSGAWNGHMYRCHTKSQAVFVRSCRILCAWTQQIGAHCPCEEGRVYCGHELRLEGIKVAVDQALYNCTESGIQLLENCDGHCSTGQCANNAPGSCGDTRVHCGHWMLSNGFVSQGSNQSLDLHALYQCSDPYTPVEVCPGGCHTLKAACFVSKATKG